MSIASVIAKVGTVATVGAGGYWLYKKLRAASSEISAEERLRELNEELNKSWKILSSCAKAAKRESVKGDWLTDYEVLRDRMTGPRDNYQVVAQLLNDINLLVERVVSLT